MKLNPVSFNGTNINDGTNYLSNITKEQPLAPAVSPIWVSRAGAWPILAGKDFQGEVLNLELICQGTWNTQLETILKLFSTEDETPRQFICADQDNSNKQYYVYASAFQIGAQDGPNIVISLAVDDPIWQSVTLNSQTWNITASAQSTDFVAAGNDDSWPVYEITPTAYPTDGYIYNQFVLMYPTSTDAWPNRPLEITGGGWDTASLISDAANSVQINLGGGISSDTDVIPYDTVVGTIPSAGVGYCGTEQISWTGKSGTQLTGVSRGINGTTAATHADNAVIFVSQMQVDGDDVRVFVDGVEVSRWFGTGANAMNAAATKIWVALNIPQKQQLTLKTALASSDTITEVEFNYTTANKQTLQGMRAIGRILIDAEEFAYTARTLTATKLALTIGDNAIRNTAVANHAVNATVINVPYDINIIFGSTGAAAPDTDNTQKPVIALTGTNASFPYTEFADRLRKRAGSFVSQTIALSAAGFSKSGIYTGINNGGDTDPAAIAGAHIDSYQRAGVWKPETSSIAWAGRFTDTVSTILFSGEQFQTNASWPAIAALQGSTDGTNWATIQNISAQAATDYGTYTNFSYATSDITVPSNIGYLRFLFNGTVKATANNVARFGPTAITVVMSNPPTVSMRTKQSNYHFAVTLSNSTTGESLQIAYPLKINQTLYIDTDPDFPTAKFNGNIVNGCLFASSIRPCPLKWQAGTNSITLTATYFGNTTIVAKWRDRFLWL